MATQNDLLSAKVVALAQGLRGWRRLHGVKQLHAAELLGVSQALLSKWEVGAATPGPHHLAALARLLSAALDGAGDRRLARFVIAAPEPMHLICDLTHKLLATSPSRAHEFHLDASEMLGRSLWPAASDDLVAAERRLDEMGWFRLPAPVIAGRTSAWSADLLHIPAATYRWTRLRLSDGSWARLVETVNEQELAESG